MGDFEPVAIAIDTGLEFIRITEIPILLWGNVSQRVCQGWKPKRKRMNHICLVHAGTIEVDVSEETRRRVIGGLTQHIRKLVEMSGEERPAPYDRAEMMDCRKRNR